MSNRSSVDARGYQSNVVVKTPSGAICRPSLVVEQDVISGAILAWRYVETEGSGSSRAIATVVPA